MITFAYSDNSEDVAKSLEGFEQVLADQSPALREVADDFREMVAAQFTTEGRAEGTPWAARHHPLTPASSRRGATARKLPSSLRRGSAKRGVVKSANPPLLVRTGALRDSLTRQGAAGHVEEVDRDLLTIGSRLPYAGFHQFGTRRTPARPLIVLSDTRAARWTDFVQRAIEAKTLLLGKVQLT